MEKQNRANLNRVDGCLSAAEDFNRPNAEMIQLISNDPIAEVAQPGTRLFDLHLMYLDNKEIC